MTADELRKALIDGKILTQHGSRFPVRLFNRQLVYRNLEGHWCHETDSGMHTLLLHPEFFSLAEPERKELENICDWCGEVMRDDYPNAHKHCMPNMPQPEPWTIHNLPPTIDGCVGPIDPHQHHCGVKFGLSFAAALLNAAREDARRMMEEKE
jgi:hypothetical protein